jgi:hypothetical protein
MKLPTNPKKLFFIDGCGAILSAFLLGIVLVRFEKYVGIPPATLYFLAAFPTMFTIYDWFSYLQSHNKQPLLLRGIALFNFLYCGLSIGVAYYHYETLTIFGWIYFFIEILIVMILANWELKIGKHNLGQFFKSCE